MKQEKTNEELNELKNLIKNSLLDLYNNDQLLFDKNVCERSKVFHLARYMCCHIKDTSFKEYNVDYEYNRSKDEEKRIKRTIDEEGKLPYKNIYPDVIIHKRGENDDNILVLEIKCDTNNDKEGYENDKDKLIQLTKKENYEYEYLYRYGMHLILNEEGDNIKYAVYANGNIIEEGELTL